MSNKSFYLLLAIALCLASSCKKDDNNNISNSIDWGAKIQADIAGQVLDESGIPISGATVTVGDSNTTTDNNGAFYLGNVSVYENLGYVYVTQSGYFKGSRSFLPTQGTNVVNIRMLAKNNIGSISGASGGNVSGEGVSITFNGGSFIRNGTPYNGQVSVALNYINPESEFFAEEMPGNLLGVQDGSSSRLVSYGMVAVELTDDNGSEVEIADGYTATVNLPVPLSLQSSAPDEIDLWSFDETNGYWVHEGKATLQGGIYVADVHHFSFWNCDVPSSFVMINGQIVDAQGIEVQGVARVKITSNTYGTETDYTSSTGYFGGYVPDGEILNITVEVSCGNSGYQIIYAGQIGSFSSATTLAPITISNPSSSTLITGSVVDCNNNVIPGGYVVAGEQVYFLNNGQFSFLACGTTLSITPYASPVWAAGQTQNITLVGGTYNAGALQACNSGANTGTVTDIDGNVYQTVLIGNQWWMQENLRVSAGIAQVSDSVQWANIHRNNLQTPAWCYYQNNPANGATYGKLYNLYAVNTGNLCPSGWHIPTDAEWRVLVEYLGYSGVAGGAMKSILGWDAPNTDATNSSGFSGLPGGHRTAVGGFYSVGSTGTWWSSPEANALGAWFRRLQHNSGSADRNFNSAWASSSSYRCIRD